MGAMLEASDFAAARKAMVESQLRPSGVDDPRLVAAMAVVPREAFVPADRRAVAYMDRPIALGAGRELAAPTVTARLLTELRLGEGDRVLIVGAAAGYSAALAALLGAEPTALEEGELAARARDALAATGYADVRVVEGALAEGEPDGAPYDAILIDGAVEHVPPALVAQLADGGRLAAVVLDEGVGRLVLGRKSGDAFGLVAFEDGDAAPLPGFGRPRPFTF